MPARSRRPLTWADAQIIGTLFRSPSLRAASKILKVDESTVSRKLAKLEAELGFALFSRTGEGLQPLAVAKTLMPHVAAVESALAVLEQKAGSLVDDQTGSIRITAPSLVAQMLVIPSLSALAKQLPKQSFDLDVTTEITNLGRRDADIAFRMSRLTGENLICSKIANFEMSVFGSQAYVSSRTSNADMTEFSWVSWSEDLSHLPLAKWLAHEFPNAQVAFRSGDAFAQLIAVEAGCGLAVLPVLIGKLRRLSEVPCVAASHWPPPRAELWLVSQSELHAMPGRKKVWDEVLKEVRSRLARAQA